MKKLLNTVFVNNPDRYLSLDGENLVIKQEDEVITRLPLHNVERIITVGYAGVSPALMGKCVKDEIDLIFMDYHKNKFLARIEGPIKGNVLLRKQQYRYTENQDISLKISKNIIAAKLHNSRLVIDRTIRDHSLIIDTDKFRQKSDFIEKSKESINNITNIDSLRGVEGEAASVYFSLFDDMILQQKDDFYFKRRNKKPPLDNVNALLSLTYTLTTQMYVNALECVGLDPYVGFMHTDRPGRPSLALDLVEELRSVLCDRFVLSIINRKIINANDFTKRENGAVALTKDGRNKFFSAWKKRIEGKLSHPYLKEEVEWGKVPYSQALILARYIRGDYDCYPPFVGK